MDRPCPINNHVKRTAIYEAHVKLGARMAPFGGWDMPIQYEGILAEHTWTRTAASLFDTCHMGEFDLQGPTAQADLERLLTQSVSSLALGQCRYGYLLRDDGGVLDDLTCYRRGPDHFMLCVNAGTCPQDAEWIRAHVSPSTRFTDLSPQTAKLDVQGPESRAAFEEAFGTQLPDLKYFRFTDVALAGVTCTLSRTGYTGEWGYEIFFPVGEAVRFWELLLGQGRIKPAGLGARDTLRLEMGYPLYGHELSMERTPIAASRGQYVDLKKNFIGHEAVRRDLEKGVLRYLAGLQLESRRAARAGDKVVADGREVGIVTSGSVAPSLGVAVAMAYVDRELCAAGQKLGIDAHGALLPATVVDLPFYKNGTARKK